MRELCSHEAGNLTDGGGPSMEQRSLRVEAVRLPATRLLNVNRVRKARVS